MDNLDYGKIAAKVIRQDYEKRHESNPNLTFRYLARKMNVSKNAVWNVISYESSSKLTFSFICKYAEALSIPLDVFMGKIISEIKAEKSKKKDASTSNK